MCLYIYLFISMRARACMRVCVIKCVFARVCVYKMLWWTIVEVLLLHRRSNEASARQEGRRRANILDCHVTNFRTVCACPGCWAWPRDLCAMPASGQGSWYHSEVPRSLADRYRRVPPRLARGWRHSDSRGVPLLKTERTIKMVCSKDHVCDSGEKGNYSMKTRQKHKKHNFNNSH